MSSRRRPSLTSRWRISNRMNSLILRNTMKKPCNISLTFSTLWWLSTLFTRPSITSTKAITHTSWIRLLEQSMSTVLSWWRPSYTSITSSNQSSICHSVPWSTDSSTLSSTTSSPSSSRCRPCTGLVASETISSSSSIYTSDTSIRWTRREVSLPLRRRCNLLRLRVKNRRQ